MKKEVEYMLNNKEIGRRIRQCRIELELSIETIANILCISPSYLGIIERGGRSINTKKVAILSDCFGVTIDYLLKGEKEDNVNKRLKVLENMTIEEATFLFNLLFTIREYNCQKEQLNNINKIIKLWVKTK